MSKHQIMRPTDQTNNPNYSNIALQERDLHILQTIGKWYTISPDHIVRTLQTYEETKHHYVNNNTPITQIPHRFVIRRRIAELNKTETPPTTHAYLTGTTKQITYWLTPAGGELIGAPFSNYPNGNTQRAPHAWAAADIGIRLQQENYITYSERETATGETIDRTTEIWEHGNPINPTHGSKASNPQHHTMRPDLTIPTADGRFIFIEVERKISGARSYYERKLNSYLANPKIAAIWYITDKKVVAQRVHGVYQRIKPNHHPKPFRVLPMITHPNGYTQFTGWDKNTETLTNQLTELQALTQENTHE